MNDRDVTIPIEIKQAQWPKLELQESGSKVVTVEQDGGDIILRLWDSGISFSRRMTPLLFVKTILALQESVKYLDEPPK